jgi:hypothetical protein
MRTRLNLIAIATAFVSLSSVGATPPDVPSNQAPGLVPPQALVDVGNAAPLIRYNRYLPGGGHTNGGATGGWQIAHALAVRAGNTSADAKLLEQIAYNLDGANALSANGGYPAQHELHLTATYAIVRHVPRFWNERLTADQRRTIDLVMTAAMVGSAYTTADATYAGGAPTALDGDTNLHRNWNPNFREGMFGALIAAMVYFGGVDAVTEPLRRYDHAAFVADRKAAGLDNIHETFTWAVAHPSSRAPDGAQIERHIRNYRYRDRPLPAPMDLYRELTLHTYGRPVNCGLNDGRSIDVDGVRTGTMVTGCDTLPNKGRPGMLLEFAGVDADGPRSSIGYAYDGFRANLTNHLLILAGGYWRPGPQADELIRLLDVGVTDLRYKLEHGYRNYSRGRGSPGVSDITSTQRSWTYRVALPLWEQVVRPSHLPSR